MDETMIKDEGWRCFESVSVFDKTGYSRFTHTYV